MAMNITAERFNNCSKPLSLIYYIYRDNHNDNNSITKLAINNDDHHIYVKYTYMKYMLV